MAYHLIIVFTIFLVIENKSNIINSGILYCICLIYEVMTLTFETLSSYIPSTGIKQYTTTPELEQYCVAWATDTNSNERVYK